MADLLPSTPDTSAAEDADPRVVGVDSDDADDLIAALSSGTARDLLAGLHEEPANPAKLADAVDTTIQNAQYHLEKLEDAGLIEVVDTVYSEKGREMNVYAPSDRPLVVVAGREEEASGVQSALARLLGALGVLALSSALVQQLLTGSLLPFGLGSAGDGPSGGPGGAPAEGTPTPADQDLSAATGTPTAVADAAATPTPTDAVGVFDATATPTPKATQTAAEAATPTAMETATRAATEAPLLAPDPVSAVEPGLLFFAGGAAVLVVGFAVRHVRR